MKNKWILLSFVVFFVFSCGGHKETAYTITDPYVNAELGRNPGVEQIKVIRDMDIKFEEEEKEKKKTELITPKDKTYFARVLGVKPSEITNQKLYAYIKEWEGVPYLYGGETKKGVDCSALMRDLYHRVYDVELPRTASEIMLNDEYVAPFRSVKYLKEGDLVFFRSNNEKIMTHVGIYLKNMKFLSATESGGVRITSLEDPYWRNTYKASGRIRLMPGAMR
ncbi:C40 family peptidase [Sinomicrobium weinanense]|uniref:C40 family peptidase n=1 Tax=Sinomicrobium weinanense TaxID=2842200 RepID=A0A926Q5C6_9FLAO|nr:NlpC/P60 family protein [Sinomicrobium weinanense]MBC9798011.1 C40 family peptidase [Sinomicrobium weinanense]MBU3123608.1 C40 family peptidase [Sinomicrobium weinanense]